MPVAERQQQPVATRFAVGLLTLVWAASLAAAQEGQPIVPIVPPAAPPPSAEIGRPAPMQGPGTSPLTYMPPPPAAAPPPPSAPAPSPFASPFLDPGPQGWGPAGELSAPPGWFFDTQLAIIAPALKFKLQNDTPLPSGNTLHVPTVSMGVTVSPTFEAGFRLPDSAGFFSGSYRFFNAEGSGGRDIDGVSYGIRTRAVVNQLALDYGVVPFEFAPHYTVAWRLGFRLDDVFFDSRATGPNAGLQQASNKFFGAGPHARIDLERRLAVIDGLSLFGSFDGAVLIGQVKQRFREEVPGDLGTAVYTDGTRRSQAVPYINLQVGVTYVPRFLPNVKLTAGYQFEDYFNVGKIGASGSMLSQSKGELWSHGAFLRAQIDY